MKQEIRFLDVIERDFESRKKQSIKMVISSAICFFVGMMTIYVSNKDTTMELKTFIIIMIIGALTAFVPIICSTPYILGYMGRRQNRNDWNEITKRFSLNEEITVYNSRLKNYIFASNMDLLTNLLVDLFPEDDMKIIITQGEEAEKEVKIIYMLSNGMTVTETFTCFQNDYVKGLMEILGVY